MGALSTLSGAYLQASVAWTAQDTLTGAAYQPISQSTTIAKKQTFANTTANANLGGADQVVSYIATVAASGNLTVNLQNVSNILQGACNFARVKGWCLQLLSTTDDSVNGTTCTSVTVGNAAANQFNLNLAVNATSNMYIGGAMQYFDQQAAGFVVGNSAKNILFTNNDSTNTAALQLTFFGGST